MTPERLAARIRSLELQLAMLRADAERMKPAEPPLTNADLFGAMPALLQITDEDIEAAEYRFDWEDEDE